jgi:hypothetical protein
MNLAIYQQEREKMNVDWIMSKKDLEDKKGEFINKEREAEQIQRTTSSTYTNRATKLFNKG